MWSELTEEAIVRIYCDIVEDKVDERKFLGALQGVDLTVDDDSPEGQIKRNIHKQFTPKSGNVRYISAEAPVEELRAMGIIGGIGGDGLGSP